MIKIVFHFQNANLRELGQLTVTLLLSLIGAFCSYAAVSKLQSSAFPIWMLFLLAAAVTLIFCGVLGSLLLIGQARSRQKAIQKVPVLQPQTNAIAKIASAQMDLSSG